MPDTSPNRCRIVLIAPQGLAADVFVERFGKALAGGDVASVILPAYELGEVEFQELAEKIVPIAQAKNVAVVIAGESRIAARTKADGVHVAGGRAALDDAIDRLQGKMIVGTGGAKTRDDALELGEARPDYIFFGRFGYDTKPEPHPRNLTLGRWWAEMIEVPCIVMAGADVESTRDVAATGAEFVALSNAVFSDAIDPAAAIARANAILDEVAQRFKD
ncbi:MAG TPA: thiamine phosphate synthase [Rhizobiaceae bacterium]|nr:thiamine phosphate synthase [Rhizobiaceae bacterium]